MLSGYGTAKRSVKKKGGRDSVEPRSPRIRRGPSQSRGGQARQSLALQVMPVDTGSLAARIFTIVAVVGAVVDAIVPPRAHTTAQHDATD